MITGGGIPALVSWREAPGKERCEMNDRTVVIALTGKGGVGKTSLSAAIVRILTEEHPEAKIALLPIFPRGARPDDKRRVANDKVNAVIKNYADGQTVLWFDFGDKFLEPDGTLTKRVMNDLLHPNETGYQIWWEAIHPLFKEICGK